MVSKLPPTPPPVGFLFFVPYNLKIALSMAPYQKQGCENIVSFEFPTSFLNHGGCSKVEKQPTSPFSLTMILFILIIASLRACAIIAKDEGEWKTWLNSSSQLLIHRKKIQTHYTFHTARRKIIFNP